jgi:dTDP-4-dehydrorhamnose reductase
MKKILVTGADGMLGTDLVRHLRRGPHIVLATTIRSLDITDRDQVRRVLLSRRPGIVIHTAAYTAVDRAETERNLCMAVNHEGTKNIALSCREIGAELIYISTDYVFDGKKRTPYVETDTPSPINVYGESKWLGEEAVRTLVERHKICRSSWLIGLHGVGGMNFVEKILHAASAGNVLRVVDDQIGRPTFTFDFALLLEWVMGLHERGIFHLTNTGECSWYNLAQCVLEMSGRSDVEIVPVSSTEYQAAARRPANSLLNSPRLESLGISPLRHWREALRDYFIRRKKSGKKD